MSGQPPPGPPPKYKVATPHEAPVPKSVQAPPPRKLRLSHRAALFRVVIVLVILISITVACWSFFLRLQPLQRESRLTLARVSKMTEQIDQAERRWPRGKVDDIRARYREVHAQLFADQDDLQQWLRQIHTEASPLALGLNVRLGESASQAAFTTNLAIIPAVMSLEVRPASGDEKEKSRYERVLAFARQLAAHGKRADLAELTVVGGTSSISRAVLVINLWTGDLGAEAEIATNAPDTNSLLK
jgi:hypothetical protein